MNHASLFSGIGGFDLAAQWAGWTNAFNCEIDPFCGAILKYHFPYATQYRDIKTVDFSVWNGRIDILTGGFPCQPFSNAGKRRGTADNRYLWPEMLRAIRQISPRYVVGENVRGIVTWSKGLVFERVCIDLEAAGYCVQPFILPACGVGAPHRRDRVWFVAHAHNAGDAAPKRKSNRLNASSISGRHIAQSQPRRYGDDGAIAHAYNQRQRQQPRDTIANKSRQFSGIYAPTRFDTFPTQSPVCRGDDGFSDRLDGITFPRWRAESIKAYGNAIVPQVALQIFNAINQYEIINNEL